MTLRKTCRALTHRGNLGTVFQMLQLSHRELSKVWGNKISSRRGSGLLAKMAGEDVYFMAEGSARCTPRMPVSSNKITFLLIKRLSNSALGPAFLMRDEVCLLDGVHNRWKCLRAKWERAQLGKLLKPISKTQKKACWPTWVYCGVVNKGSIYASWPARAAVNENKSASCKLNTSVPEGGGRGEATDVTGWNAGGTGWKPGAGLQSCLQRCSNCGPAECTDVPQFLKLVWKCAVASSGRFKLEPQSKISEIKLLFLQLISPLGFLSLYPFDCGVRIPGLGTSMLWVRTKNMLLF